MLNRDYSTTKRCIKEHILDVNEKTLPEGFVRIPESPIHAVNQFGEIIRIRTRKYIQPSVNRKGYLQVCLQNKKSYRIHRLVAELFISNPDHKPQVNHKDGNKHNNHFNNLEWVFNQENQDHAILNGLWDGISEKTKKRQTGETNSAAKLSESDVLSIYQKLKEGFGVTQLARQHGITHSMVSNIKSGKSWSHLYHIYLEGSTTISQESTL
ncbi:HNH endonuclease [Nostoc sp. 2RC]|nr:HNH endonuclease [Nostoc sp. 2RC]